MLAPAASVFGVVVKTNTNTPADAGRRGPTVPGHQYPAGPPGDHYRRQPGSSSSTNLDAPQSYVVQFAFPPGSPGQFTNEIPILALSEQRNCAVTSAPTVK